MRPLRLLSISHSYVVALNRRLPEELQRCGRGRWEVTTIAPSSFQGDLRHIDLEASLEGEGNLVPVRAFCSRVPHLFFYGPELHRILKEPWDLVHVWEEPYVLAGAQLCRAARPDTPLVFATFQNLEKTYPPPLRQFERRVLSRVSGCIAYGHTVERALRGRLGAGRPIRVIPIGVDVERFAPDPGRRPETLRALGWTSEGPPVIGFLGRFIEAKGLGLLMQALERQTGPWRALFVGGGPLEPALRRWGERFSDGRVRVKTGVPHDEVPRYLNAMDVLCAPSQTTVKWREQFGRMLTEAFACGVAVVGSDSGEIPHTIGDAGLVVGERDVAGWTAALAALLADPVRRGELGARGLERARGHFAWDVVARAHLDFFDELAAPRSRRRTA